MSDYIASMNVAGEYIYLHQEREFLYAKKPIYKIGKTKQLPNKRMNAYPKGSLLLLTVIVTNCDIAEKELLSVFREKYNNLKEIGAEYFEGNVYDMINTIFEYQHKTFDYDKVVNKEKINEELDRAVEDLIDVSDLGNGSGDGGNLDLNDMLGLCGKEDNEVVCKKVNLVPVKRVPRIVVPKVKKLDKDEDLIDLSMEVVEESIDKCTNSKEIMKLFVQDHLDKLSIGWKCTKAFNECCAWCDDNGFKRISANIFGKYMNQICTKKKVLRNNTGWIYLLNDTAKKMYNMGTDSDNSDLEENVSSDDENITDNTSTKHLKAMSINKIVEVLLSSHIVPPITKNDTIKLFVKRIDLRTFEIRNIARIGYKESRVLNMDELAVDPTDDIRKLQISEKLYERYSRMMFANVENYVITLPTLQAHCFRRIRYYESFIAPLHR